MNSAGRLVCRNAEPEELPRVYEMLVEAYGAADRAFPRAPAFFARYTDADPHPRAGLWFVGELGGEPVTALRVFDRQLLLGGGKRARLAGVGNVGTHPAHWRQGYGSELLRHALDEIRNQGFDLSLLYTGTPAFYARHGWRAFGVPARRRRLAAPLTRPAEVTVEVTVEVTEGATQDWGGLTALYASSYGDCPGALARCAAYWERWVGGFALGHYGYRLMVASRGAEPVAYLAGKTTPEGELRVAEGAARAGRSDVLAVLVSLMGEGAIAIRVPEVPWLVEAAERLAGSTETLMADGGMVNALHEVAELSSLRYLLSDLDRF